MAVATVAPQAYQIQQIPPAALHQTEVSLASSPLLDSKKTPAAAPGLGGGNALPGILVRIAWCESHNRQFDEKGTVVRGEHNPKDIGKFQINETQWGVEAKRLGLDIYTEDGNEKMALDLYRRYGTTPWYWSQPCWDKY